MLCSVVKHLGSDQSTQEVGKFFRIRPVFLPTLLSCSSRFLRALPQNRAQSRLFKKIRPFASLINCLIYF